MAKDNVLLTVQFNGKREEASGLDKALADEVVNKTGLRLDDVSFSGPTKYSATLHASKDKKTYSGESVESPEAAIRVASEEGKIDFDQSRVLVAAERTAEVPYFTVPVISMSLCEGDIDAHHADAVTQLRNTYGNRIKDQPESVSFRVIRSNVPYSSDRQLPKGKFKGKNIVREGTSQKSWEDAARESGPMEKGIKSTIYEQTTQVIVYGVGERSFTGQQREEKLGSSEIVIAQTVPVYAGRTSRERVSSYRGAAPAARDPAYFVSLTALM